MEKPLISICIPTYNRADFLKECLESIVIQFAERVYLDKIEVVVLDNISDDKTGDVIKEYTEKFPNIRYFLDNEKRGIAAGQIKVATLAKGEYLWFFSDDDKHSKNSIFKVISAIAEFSAEAIFCNTSTFIGSKIICNNNFKINKNYYFKNKKNLFDFVNKHFYCKDYFFTFMSNFIIKKDVFNGGMDIINKYNSKLDLYPFHLPIYYTDSDFTFIVVGDPVVEYRADNVSWGPSDKLKHELFTDKLVNNHLKNILFFNKNYISKALAIKLFLAKIKRNTVVFFLVRRKIRIINFIYVTLKIIKNAIVKNE